MSFRLDLVQWRFENGGFTYEGVADAADLSANAVWKFIKGKGEPSASTLRAVFEAMGLDPKQAFNDKLKRSQFRRAVVATAR
jgi:transcriptional regulator with XRE-family HTH domain